MYFVFTTEIVRTNKNLSCGRELDTKNKISKSKLKNQNRKELRKRNNHKV